jgi:hypothetical protein
MLCNDLHSGFEKLRWSKLGRQFGIYTAVNGLWILHPVQHNSDLRSLDEVGMLSGRSLDPTYMKTVHMVSSLRPTVLAAVSDSVKQSANDSTSSTLSVH